MKNYFFVVSMLLSCLVSLAPASEFRSIVPIGGDRGFGRQKGLPSTVVPPEVAQAVERRALELARKGLRGLVQAWNGAGFDEYLADGFFDKTRLLDSLSIEVPRDARLRVLAIEGIQVLGQRIEGAGEGKALHFVSRVAITARTQVDYNEPGQGFRRIEGVNEYILRINQWLDTQ